MWQRVKESEDVGEKESNKSPSSLPVNWWRAWSDGPRAHLYPAWHQKWKCNFLIFFFRPHTRARTQIFIIYIETDTKRYSGNHGRSHLGTNTHEEWDQSASVQISASFASILNTFVQDKWTLIWNVSFPIRILYLCIKYTTQSSLIK